MPGRRLTGFPPVASRNSLILVLGSMPGTESLRRQQYYAHPRNAFWRIMSGVLGYDMPDTYERKTALLRKHRIALWDVIKHCTRPGSLDLSIRPDSVVLNDLSGFLRLHRQIRAVFFNGRKAEVTFTRKVLPLIDRQDINYEALPSTSPAYSGLSIEAKSMRWKIILDWLE